ncbi:uncharacterized protein LOC112515248 [Cynara cardunculus var. scolymus]|uniref:6,7-dimethyl-8-ribityllumazine synthase n=1 Tax=Cynara cardunculus var. scolymus TaxID=59895 RepID=A0A103YHZ0_CYNCS|nr:uncharacterized protein LOC112515248 [Cynara cardunculus var. scolymus]KVI09455.1 hypothetical protein Ccrd_012173 [Cynara cardunculus var. scolymus]
MILNTPTCTHTFTPKNHHPTTTATLLPKTLFLPRGLPIFGRKIKGFSSDWGFVSDKTSGIGRSRIKSSLIEAPVLWAGRVCIFYALLKAGLAGSPSNPLASTTELESDGDDLGFSKWFAEFKGKPEKEAADKRKLVSKWHPTTKGTLRRNYRIPSTSEGRRLLKAIASLLSDDDHFRDATSHKGCQIRRESAHGETVCCNNVRALFDELPTPHLVVEITPFPAGPLTESDYARAEKLEKVLRSGPSV